MRMGCSGGVGGRVTGGGGTVEEEGREVWSSKGWRERRMRRGYRGRMDGGGSDSDEGLRKKG